MADTEIRKKIGEHFTVALDFTPKLPSNVTVVSGLVLATRRGKMESALLTAPVSPGAMTVTLDMNVQAGAALIINIGLTDEEPLLVRSISGTGPYTATLMSAAQLAHAANATVRYEQGATDLILATETATASHPVLGANLIGGLVYQYTLAFFATLSSGQVIRDDVSLVIQD